MAFSEANPAAGNRTFGETLASMARRTFRRIREAFEATPPASSEWYVAGEILGAVPVRINESAGPGNPAQQ